MPIPFRPIAIMLSRTLHPTPRLEISSVHEIGDMMRQDGQKPGVLITVNHYHASDFQAWWFVILISALVPWHVHWVVTSGWTNSGWLTGLTHWLFPLGARLLGFTAMPAMPPDPEETIARATAVRRVLRYAKRVSAPVIGMAPEGRDIAGGVLGSLPSGVGRFLFLLSQSCPLILPVGIWKENSIVNVKFGSPYRLNIPGELSARSRDTRAGNIVMQAIAQCLPDHLRGEYGHPGDLANSIDCQ
jgi:hypothetical protein